MEPPARRGRPKEGAEAGRVISLVGPSNSGKTGLICRLVEHFRAKGLKVAVLKHSHKPILAQALEVRRYREAGVSTVALAGPHLLHLNRSYPGEPPLAEILRLLAPAVDLVLVEGYKSGDLPKIALAGPGSDEAPVHLSRVVALVSEEPAKAAVPVFKPGEVAELGRFILTFLAQEEGSRS